MNNRRYSKFLAGLITSLILLTLSVNPAYVASASLVEPAKAAEAPSLLQFTAGGHALSFTADGIYAATGTHALHVDFVGANAVQPQVDSPASSDGKAVLLSRVIYAGLWDGISLTYMAETGSIYTTSYMLAPGADPAAIRLRYNALLSLNKDGTLSTAFETGRMTESAPIAWQEIQGQRVKVDASFQIHGQEVSFALGSYDPRYALEIDPSLTWNTFLGGSGYDWGTAIAVDASGNVYVAGVSNASWGSPVRGYSGGDDDAFVAKMDSFGNLIWNTFLGGSGDDQSFDIAIDTSGNVYISGFSLSTWGNPVRGYSGGFDGFIAKLNSSGGLSWNTFLGGSGDDRNWGIAVGTNGNIYVTGDSSSTWGNPVRPWSNFFAGDAFAAKLDSSGGLTWNTFMGGSWTYGIDIAIDSIGNVYVAGISGATWGNPVRAFSIASFNYSDAFAAKLDGNGNLIWNTFLGGDSSESDGIGIAVDGSGNVYVSGTSHQTWGTPVMPFPMGSNNTFAAKLDISGNLIWNTFLSRDESQASTAISVDQSGNVYVVGDSDVSWGSPVRPYSGFDDAFAAKLDSSGGLTWNTFLGGSESDIARGVVVDTSGNVYVTGESLSTWGSPVRGYSDSFDAFVARLGDNIPPSWTIMVYLDGDNNLDSNYFNVFNQLENAANNPNLNIVVLWDRSGNNNTAYYKVKYDTDLSQLATYTEGVDRWSKGELDMGDPASLSDFVQWARTNYPAQHYALLISNHGTGLNGTALDQTNGNDWITVNELGTALSTATSNGSDKLDIVFADSCLMGMIEDGYQIRNYANFFIASENEIWITASGSRPYSDYFTGISSSTTPQELATTFVIEYASWLDDTFPGKYGYTLSAVDLTKIDPLVSAVSNLGAMLSPQITTYAAQIQTARNATQKFDSDGNNVINTSDEYVDLADLASELKTIPDTDIQNAAQDAIDAVGNYVIANTAKSGNTYSGLDPNRIHGVSLFFPTGDIKRSFYNRLNLDFANGTTWSTQNMPALLQQQILGWGPLLVDYVENITPAATDDPNPPDLASPMETQFLIYLPLIFR